MRHIFLALVLLISIGCSNTPTAPTPPPTPAPTPTPTPTPPPTARTLRWDIVASGCTATASPTPLPDPTRATYLAERDGLIPVTWDYVSSQGQRGILTALFRASGNELHICSWELSDL
jgi:hypothetical protein